MDCSCQLGFSDLPKKISVKSCIFNQFVEIFSNENFPLYGTLQLHGHTLHGMIIGDNTHQMFLLLHQPHGIHCSFITFTFPISGTLKHMQQHQHQHTPTTCTYQTDYTSKCSITTGKQTFTFPQLGPSPPTKYWLSEEKSTEQAHNSLRVWRHWPEDTSHTLGHRRERESGREIERKRPLIYLYVMQTSCVYTT